MTPEESKAPVSLRDELADEHVAGWTVDGDTWISNPNARHIANAVLASEPMQAIRKALHKTLRCWFEHSQPCEKLDCCCLAVDHFAGSSVVEWVMGE